MQALEEYIREVRDIRSSGAGVAETSYYPALVGLLNAAGKTLKPRVRCISQLANRGAGSPDIGLFTPDQFQRAGEVAPLPCQIPARGVVEVKGTADDAWLKADGEQVTRYWGKYRQVLVTNLRDFVLVGQDSNGDAAKLETYRLAASEAEFWARAATPRRFVSEHGARFEEFLRRVLTNAAPLTSPSDVAWHLASYAREALARVEAGELAALASVRGALEEGLITQDFTRARCRHPGVKVVGKPDCGRLCPGAQPVEAPTGWLRPRFKIATLLLLLCLSGCTSADRSPADAGLSLAATATASPDRLRFFVERVVDGETIELYGGTRLIYAGVDAPELGNPQECFGVEAAERNKRLVEGKWVEIEKDVTDTERVWGYLLRYVYLDGTLVNDVVIREGYARALIAEPDVRLRDQLLQAQAEAQQAQRGLWNACVD